MAKRLALTARTLQRCAQRCSSAKQLMARYLHTFLFRCPQCGEPVEVARKSDEAACEQLDAQPFSLVCLSCRKLFGAPDGIRWSVKPWLPDSCDSSLRRKHELQVCPFCGAPHFSGNRFRIKVRPAAGERKRRPRRTAMISMSLPR